MYKELLLFPDKLREQVVYPDVARKIVAQACDGHEIDPAIFARDAQGKTLQGRYGDDRKGEGFGLPPAIIFDGGMGFIRLYGIGATGTSLLSSQAMSLVSALSNHFGGPLRMEYKEGNCDLKPSKPILYSVRRLVMAKKPSQLERFWKTNAVDRCAEVRKELLSGLISQSRWLDNELGGESNLEGRIPADDALLLDILEGESVPVEIKPGVSGMAYKNLTFCTNLELSGPWLAGKLRSRGYGMIRRRIER